MKAKLAQFLNRYNEVADLIVQPDIIADQEQYIKLNKEYKELSKIVIKSKEYDAVTGGIEEATQVLKEEKDPEMLEMAKEELEENKARLPKLEEEIKFLLIPKNPEDVKNAVMEIRAGTGGDEASIFAGDLYRMYTRYAEIMGWKTELVDYSEGTSGGYKEITFNITSEDVYGKLKFEAGVHRVQRVPQTETQGRVHTSAASVVVMPEAEEFDVKIDMNDIRRDFFCSSGPGGQSVNTTYSAVRLTHLPTGVVAQCQDEKSQTKNMDKAMKVLRSRIYELELQKRMENEGALRKSMVSSGDRSAKIRTYNYPQGRITDHRISLTVYNLNEFINGNIGKMQEELIIAENTEKLKESSLS